MKNTPLPLLIFSFALFMVSCSGEHTHADGSSHSHDQEHSHTHADGNTHSHGESSHTSAATKRQPANGFVAAIEKRHQKAAFLGYDAIGFDIELFFGGSKRLDAKMTLSTDSRYARIDREDGNTIIVKDDKVYASPGLKDDKSVRFAAYTWSYFFMLPYKLSDDGTQWEDYSSTAESESGVDAMKLSFESGTGDAPDDWYIVFADEKLHRITHAAYIVTAGASQAEAEEDPHAIAYDDYSVVQGVPIAHSWTFWGWREGKGLTDQLGNATLSSVNLMEDATGTFDVPEDYLEVPSR